MRNKCKWLLILVALNTSILGCIGAKCVDLEKGAEFQNPADGVCNNVDIRITMDQFRKLENCTVIEGFLHISLIERAVYEDYEKWSFPELREITGYVRLYRVYGLKTLRYLFPNLTVIGGRPLFNNYALVAYEMPDLEELGLISLRTISRGGVRITKSKKLCYVDTIDWGRLGVDNGAQDFKDNKEESQCANYCPEECHTTRVGNVDAKRCWTSQHCQQGLSCKCRVNQTCMVNGTCCHDYCVGGCTGTGPGDCISCKGVTYLGKCYPECPPHTFMFSDRRCLTDKECLALVNNTEDVGKNTKILRGEKGKPSICVTKCPQNYTIKEEGELKHLECVKCQGFCPKVCNSTDVSSIEEAEKLKDCSKIVGPLIIQIMSGSNVAQEMEKNLGNIKEVTGYISIRRSYALLTLYFLKSLETFGDSPLYQGRSLIVMDNSNLQELFPEEQMKRFKFKHGKVSFHGNRKLCLYKIHNFVKYLNLSQPPTEQDISTATNGDLISCTEKHLNLKLEAIFHNTVMMNWTKDTSDDRHLLTYIINYKEIKDKNEVIDIYQGRDACSADTWMTSEQPPTQDSEAYQTYILTGLDAYTTYAIYVQAYTLHTATHAAMTNVVTFTTEPYYPSEPLDLEVSSNNPHELAVKWKPPKFPNGLVTHYKVIYQKQDIDIRTFNQRDYCNEPNLPPRETARGKEEEAAKKLNTSASCCACPKTKEELDAEARKQEIEIYFEDYLHDQVYCQRYDTLPLDITLSGFPFGTGWSDIINMDRSLTSRNTTTACTSDSPVSVTANSSVEVNATKVKPQDASNLTNDIQEVLVYNATKIVLPNLRHFQEYKIEIQACHDTKANEPVSIELCSNRAMTAGQTKASAIMDRINESTINVKIARNTTTDILITWDPPSNPNGLILNYNIYCKRANQENMMPQKICVSSRAFQKYSGYLLTGLNPGNWSYQINVVSLAGNGSLTAEKYFIIPHAPGEEGTDSVVIVIAVFVALLLVVGAISIFLYFRFRYTQDRLTVFSPNVNYVPSDLMYTIDDWEVDRDKIKLLRELGQGSFGMVYEGVAKGLGDEADEEIRVAVKTVNDKASFNDKRQFLKEATTMKAFDCFHVVKLLGVVSTGQPALVIMELMVLGDLKNYLREQRPDEQNERPGIGPPKLLDILQMAGEIADGMAYLADKKFVHRDLAARNCMVAEDKTVKIGDFGMTRDIYETDYYRKGDKGMLPVRWMAPESLKDGVFTSMSDVWSYGVVMWEMVTLAAMPYQGLSNEEVVKYISEDGTMDVPDRCPQEMSYLMKRCWAKTPKNRPTFKDIIEYLLPHLNPRFEKVSYFFSEGGSPGEEISVDCGVAEGGEDDHNCQGATASTLLFDKESSKKFYSPPHSGGSSASLYDMGLPSDSVDDGSFLCQNRNHNVNEVFSDIDKYGSQKESDTNLGSSAQPISHGRHITAPAVTKWQSSLLSPEGKGKISSELQPLISSGQGQTCRSPGPNGVQNLNLDQSQYIDFQPPAGNEQLKIAGGPPPLQQPKTTADPQTSDSPNSGGNPQPAINEIPTHQPLGLQILSQLPRLGAPQQKEGDRVADSRQHRANTFDHKFQPAAVTDNSGLISVEEEEANLSMPWHSCLPLDTVNSFSDASKENGKDSSSHSLINGLANGHIPMSTLRHRTAPC